MLLAGFLFNSGINVSVTDSPTLPPSFLSVLFSLSCLYLQPLPMNCCYVVFRLLFLFFPILRKDILTIEM